MQLNGGITHRGQAEQESQVPLRPGEGAQAGVGGEGEGGCLTQVAPVLPLVTTGWGPCWGLAMRGRWAGDSVVGRQRWQLFHLVA